MGPLSSADLRSRREVKRFQVWRISRNTIDPPLFHRCLPENWRVHLTVDDLSAMPKVRPIASGVNGAHNEFTSLLRNVPSGALPHLFNPSLALGTDAISESIVRSDEQSYNKLYRRKYRITPGLP